MLWLESKKKLQSLTQTLRDIASGNFSQRAHIHSSDGIGALAQNLDEALDTLEGALKRLQGEKEQATAILSSMAEGVIALDRDTRILSVNPAAEKLFSVTKGEAEGKFLLEVIRIHEIADLAAHVLKQGQGAVRELSLDWPLRKNIEINATALLHAGVVTGCLLVIHDITDIRHLETVRKDFVANVSHELKTPLTSIKGFVETLLEGAVDNKKDSREFLGIIQDHVNRLDTLINDLLILSSLESRQITLEHGAVSLSGLVNKVIAGFTTQSRKRNVTVINEIPESRSIQADKHRIEQVFTNLIDNGIKFNKDGGEVRIRVEDSSGETKIVVQDSGSGIPEKALPRIFERFYRIDTARSRELGGTGLGLSIVKHIVELHGGQVGVESTEGLGSSFWFTLPQ